MRGPCAKRQVSCVIKSHDGLYAYGENDCANPQEKCPRLPGEGYEKCKTICQQAGHAEIVALNNAKARGMDLQRGFAYATIYGHHWICNECGQALRDAGIDTVQLELA
jgi:deoxycytidylate deaminase